MSIRTKLLGLVVLLSVVTAAGVGGAALYAARQARTEQLESELQDRLGLVEGRLVGKLRVLAASATTWASATVMLEMRSSDPQHRIESYLASAAHSNRLVRHLTVFDRRGRTVRTTNPDFTTYGSPFPARVAAVATPAGGTADRPALATLPFKAVLGGVTRAALSGAELGDYLFIPIRWGKPGRAKRVIGALLVEIDRVAFDDALNVGNDGRPDADWINLYLASEGHELYSSTKRYAEVGYTRLQPEVAALVEGAPRLSALKLREVDYLVASRPVRVPIRKQELTMELTALIATKAAYGPVDQLTLLLGLAAALMALVAAGIGVAFARGLRRPLEALTASVAALPAQADQKIRVTIDGYAEIAALATTFNQHLDAAQRSRQGVDAQNAVLLEGRDEQTRALARLRDEIAEVLDHAPQGLLTFDRDLRINAFYTTQLPRMLGLDGALTGLDVLITLFGRNDADDAGMAVHRAALAPLFGGDQSQWSAVISQLPQVAVRAVAGETRSLRLSYAPIFAADGRIARIAVAVDDATADERRDQEAAQLGRELATVKGLARLDAATFHAFVDGCEALGSAIAAELSTLATAAPAALLSRVEHLFRLTHTLNADARLLGVSMIQDRALAIEERLERLRVDPMGATATAIPLPLPTLVEDLAAFRAALGALTRAYAELFGARPVGPDLGAFARLTAAAECLAVCTEKPLLHGPAAAGFRDDLRRSLVATEGPIDLASHVIRYDRMASELAAQLGKELKPLHFATDSRVLPVAAMRKLNSMLAHCLRNAIDHGIESPERRLAVGKPRSGELQLSVSCDAGRLRVALRDDGAGIDPVVLRAVAVERGVIDTKGAAALSDAETLELVFRPGFSTAHVVTAVSGRGAGMDAVRTLARAAGGDVRLESQPGRGLAVLIDIALPAAPAAPRLPRLTLGRTETIAWPAIRIVLAVATPETVRLSVRLWFAMECPEARITLVEAATLKDDVVDGATLTVADEAWVATSLTTAPARLRSLTEAGRVIVLSDGRDSSSWHEALTAAGLGDRLFLLPGPHDERRLGVALEREMARLADDLPASPPAAQFAA